MGHFWSFFDQLFDAFLKRRLLLGDCCPSDYKKTEEIVRAFEVVNDCSERGIKLVSDFKDATKDKEQREFSFQVIENHRNNLSNINKDNLNKL